MISIPTTITLSELVLATNEGIISRTEARCVLCEQLRLSGITGVLNLSADVAPAELEANA